MSPVYSVTYVAGQDQETISLTGEKALRARELKRFVAVPSQWRAIGSRALAAKQPK
jgi:hypothetical protein